MNQHDIKQNLTQLFSPSFIDVVDDSHKHAGHRGTHHTSNTHFTVTIVSDFFNDMPLIKRHRHVNDALKDAFSHQLHALKIIAKTPSEWHE